MHRALHKRHNRPGAFLYQKGQSLLVQFSIPIRGLPAFAELCQKRLSLLVQKRTKQGAFALKSVGGA